MEKRETIRIAILAGIYIAAVAAAFTAASAYDEGIIYSGDKPYVWSETSSVTFYSIVLKYRSLLDVGCILAVFQLIQCVRNRLDRRIPYWVYGILNGISLIYLAWVAGKYDPVIYLVNDPCIASDGTYIDMFDVLSVSIACAAAGILVVCIYMIMDIVKRKRAAEE